MPDRSIVLVVDDDPLVRLIASEMLQVHGHESLSAASADEALAVLVNRPDVGAVVTDVVMPGTLDGLGLAAEIRRRWPRKHVVIASGRVPAEAATNGVGRAFLQKPFRESDLIAALRAPPAVAA